MMHVAWSVPARPARVVFPGWLLGPRGGSAAAAGRGGGVGEWRGQHLVSTQRPVLARMGVEAADHCLVGDLVLPAVRDGGHADRARGAWSNEGGRLPCHSVR